MTEALTTIMYAIVMSRETVRIALMNNALNDLQSKLADILNTNIQAAVTEKVWTTFGPYFGKDAGKTAVINRALYGVKSAVTFFKVTLPDVWNPWGISPIRLTWIF